MIQCIHYTYNFLTSSQISNAIYKFWEVKFGTGFILVKCWMSLAKILTEWNLAIGVFPMVINIVKNILQTFICIINMSWIPYKILVYLFYMTGDLVEGQSPK